MNPPQKNSVASARSTGSHQIPHQQRIQQNFALVFLQEYDPSIEALQLFQSQSRVYCQCNDHILPRCWLSSSASSPKMIIRVMRLSCIGLIIFLLALRWRMPCILIIYPGFTDSHWSIHRDRALDQHLSLIYCSLFNIQLSLRIMQYLLLDFRLSSTNEKFCCIPWFNCINLMMNPPQKNSVASARSTGSHQIPHQQRMQQNFALVFHQEYDPSIKALNFHSQLQFFPSRVYCQCSHHILPRFWLSSYASSLEMVNRLICQQDHLIIFLHALIWRV